jgi:predicted nucleotidyltransferase component of viral defense system
MNNIEQLVKISEATNRPLDEVLTYHILESVLRRVSNSIYIMELVLRGGMLTRLWVPLGRRIAVDVDFLGLYPFDIADTTAKFQDILSAQNLNNNYNDAVEFHLDSLQTEGIWMETESPGARINIDATIGQYQRNIQIDVGFGDPLAPPEKFLKYPTLIGEAIPIQTACAETMVGWKLHGLVELGAKRWHPKTLYDLVLFAKYLKLSEIELAEAIKVAFSSRNTPLQKVWEILADKQWWHNSKNRSKWKWYVRKMPSQIFVEDFETAVSIVTERWESVVRELL